MDFAFIGGSMGAAVVRKFQEESITQSKQTSLCNDLKIRWSENDGSAYSLILAKTSKLAQLAAKIPYISLCTDPDDWRHNCFYAMLGRYQYSEPYALIAPE
jgi:acetyl-CoA carboxylase carboxyl transferase subunit beta